MAWWRGLRTVYVSLGNGNDPPLMAVATDHQPFGHHFSGWSVLWFSYQQCGMGCFCFHIILLWSNIFSCVLVFSCCRFFLFCFSSTSSDSPREVIMFSVWCLYSRIVSFFTVSLTSLSTSSDIYIHTHILYFWKGVMFLSLASLCFCCTFFLYLFLRLLQLLVSVYTWMLLRNLLFSLMFSV